MVILGPASGLAWQPSSLLKMGVPEIFLEYGDFVAIETFGMVTGD